MSLEDALRARLADHEDGLVERKEVGKADEIRQAACAFANTVRDPDAGVLFLGVDEAGKPTGKIGDPDKTQRDARRWIDSGCYPPISGIQKCAFTVEGLDVVAIVIPESRLRPHFAGHAYVRDGSETVSASEEQFQRLIDDRSDMVWALRPWIGKVVNVVEQHQRDTDGARIWHNGTQDYELLDANQFYVTLKPVTAGIARKRSVSCRRIMLEYHWDGDKPRLRIAVDAL